MKQHGKKTVLIILAVVITVAALTLAVIQRNTSRPTLDDFEGTFLMSDGRCIELKADPTDDYDMLGRIYKTDDESSAVDVVGVYTPAGAISIEEAGGEGMMIGIMSVKRFGRLEYIDMNTAETCELEKMR